MSGNALRPYGILTLKDPKGPPTEGVIVELTPDTFKEVKAQIRPWLESLGDAGKWTTGGAGSWDEEHPHTSKYGTAKVKSGDIDIWMDSDRIKQALGLDDDADVKAVQKAVLEQAKEKFPAVQGADGIHFGLPTGTTTTVPQTGKDLPTYYQIDLVIKPHAHEIARHHEHAYHKNSPYTGRHQQLAMSSLINTHPDYPEKTLQYHGFGGKVQDRATKQVLSKHGMDYTDADEAAELALGPGASADDIASVENMIKWLIKNGVQDPLKSPRLAQFVADLEKEKPKVAEGSADWFRSISQKITV